MRIPKPSKPGYLILGVLFIGTGIAVWIGVVFPRLPNAGYLRLMIGMVLVLIGIYRCALAFYSGPPNRPSIRHGDDLDVNDQTDMSDQSESHHLEP